MKHVDVSVYNVIITRFNLLTLSYAIDAIRVAYKYIITCDCVFIYVDKHSGIDAHHGHTRTSISLTCSAINIL